MKIKITICIILTFLVFSIVTNVREGIELDADEDTDTTGDSDIDTDSDGVSDSDSDMYTNSDNVCGNVQLQLLSNRINDNSKMLREQQKEIDDVKNTAKNVSSSFGDIKDHANNISDVASGMDSIGNPSE